MLSVYFADFVLAPVVNFMVAEEAARACIPDSVSVSVDSSSDLLNGVHQTLAFQSSARQIYR
jgi:hypothetical protein